MPPNAIASSAKRGNWAKTAEEAMLLANILAGSEKRFVDLMNTKANKLGMSGSHFQNATGWPHIDHYTTAIDLATLAHLTIHNFPKLYSLVCNIFVIIKKV